MGQQYTSENGNPTDRTVRENAYLVRTADHPIKTPTFGPQSLKFLLILDTKESSDTRRKSQNIVERCHDFDATIV